jgi:hypothetical protein
MREKDKKACWILVEKTKVKTRVGIPNHRYEDINKMDVIGPEWEKVEWMDLAEDRDKWRAFVNT